MDLALNNLQRFICHKTQQINQPTIKGNIAGFNYSGFSFSETSCLTKAKEFSLS